MKNVLLFLVIVIFGCSSDEKAAIKTEGSLDNPKSVPVSQSYSGQIPSGGINYYKFSITSAGSYIISLANFDANLLLKLHNDSTFQTGSLLNEMDDWNQNGEISFYNILSTKTYYLKIRELGGIDQNFTLLIEAN